MDDEPGLIDWHSHMLAPDLVPPRGARGEWPGIRVAADGAVDMMLGGRWYRRVDRRTIDPQVRVQGMDEWRVVRQVLSPPPMAVAFDGPVEEHAELARQQNDFLLSVVASAPERFSMFGVLPYGDPDLVEAEIARLQGRAGVLGVCLTARRDDALCTTRDAAMWSRIATNGWLVFVHPADTMLDDNLPAEAVFGAGMPTATGITAATVLTSGLLEQVPGLRWLLSHGGGTLPALLARLDKSFSMGRTPELQNAPSVSAQRSFWVDSVVYGQELVALVEQTLGPAAMVFGTDYPFAAAVAPDGQAQLLRHPGLLPRLSKNGAALFQAAPAPRAEER